MSNDLGVLFKNIANEIRKRLGTKSDPAIYNFFIRSSDS